MNIEKASIEEYLGLYNLVGRIEGIVQHPTHFYKIMISYFGNSILIAKEKASFVGFLLGFASQVKPSEYFIWQLGVDPQHRGKKIAKKIMEETIITAEKIGCKYVTATVETTNKASQALFESCGFRIVTNKCLGEMIEEHGKMAIKNYYASGTNQIFYRLDINTQD